MQGWYLTTMLYRPLPTYRTPPHRLWNGRYLQPTIFFEAQQTLLCLHAFRKRSGITDKPPNSIQLSPNKSDNVLMSRNHHIGGYVVHINSLLITAMVVGDLLMLPSQQREPQFMAFGEQISRHITSICVSAHSNFWHFFFLPFSSRRSWFDTGTPIHDLVHLNSYRIWIPRSSLLPLCISAALALIIFTE